MAQTVAEVFLVQKEEKLSPVVLVDSIRMKDGSKLIDNLNRIVANIQEG